jgi:uncharacterized protein (TIGR02246 family)
MSDEDAIRRTLAEYCQFCDDGRFDEFADLFATDAVFRVMGKSNEGRGQIKAFMEKAMPPEKRGKHVTTSCVIDVTGDGDEARVFTDYFFVARTDDGYGITSVGRYHDRLVKQKDRWRFAEREIVFMGGDAPTA